MRRKLIANGLKGLLITGLCGIMLTGCSFSLSNKNTDDANVNKTEYDNEESSTYRITNIKDMEDGEFYVLHDGVYYPAFIAGSSFKGTTIAEDSVDDSRQVYFRENEEINIPTLYMESGDKLIFYSKTVMPDYVQWERFEDLGYTVGLMNLSTSDTGKVYFTYDTDSDAPTTIIPNSDLEQLLTDVTDNSTFYVSKIGNVDIDKSFINDGIISNMTRNEKYSLDIYSGTQYHHYDAIANNHIFKAMELYGSIEFKTLRAYTYEVTIPSYFNTDGYYRLACVGTNGTAPTGLIRIIKNGTKFDIADKDRFNTPMLSIYTASDLLDIANGKDITKTKGIYSTCDAINKYKTEVVGSLGYKDNTEDTVTTKTKQTKLSTATIRQFKINFPKDNSCKIELIPRTVEPSGSVYLYIGNERVNLTYDAINNSYTTELTGDNNTYTLFVSGIWGSYDINLTNCHQDTNGKSSSILDSNANNNTNNININNNSNTETKMSTEENNTQPATSSLSTNNTAIQNSISSETK